MNSFGLSFLVGYLILAYAPNVGFSQVKWNEIDLCPKSLRIDRTGIKLSNPFCFFNTPGYSVNENAVLTLDTAFYRTIDYGNYGKELGYWCECVYGIEGRYLEPIEICDPNNPPNIDPNVLHRVGGVFSFFWLDKFEYSSERLCQFFEREYGKPGSKSEINGLYRQTEVNSSHKIALTIHWDTTEYIPGSIPSHTMSSLFEFATLRTAAQESIDLLLMERAIDNNCNLKLPLSGLDHLLIKNRWPTPGDRIDSIFYGQFLDSLPPSPFPVKHQIYLSDDYSLDPADNQFFSKTFSHSNFRVLDASNYPVINEDIYFSNNWISLYVDATGGVTVGDMVDFTSINKGIYHLIFKTDGDDAIAECEENNNSAAGFWIEIDAFQPGDCDVCPPSIIDNQGQTWTLSTDLPDCILCSEKYPPTSGKAYYDGESYIASCVYDRQDRDPVALAWVRWQQNKLAKDSVTYLDEMGDEQTWISFCQLDQFVDEFGKVEIPDPVRAAVGVYGHPDFPEAASEMMLNGLIGCYLSRAIDLDTLCLPSPQAVALAPDTIFFNIDNLQPDTIKIISRGNGTVRITAIEKTGDLEVTVKTPTGFPQMLIDADTLEIVLEANQNQSFGKDKTADLTFKGNAGGVPLKLHVGLVKPRLIVDNFYASVTPEASADTLYAGENNVFRCRILDEFSGDLLSHLDTIRIRAQTVKDQTTPGITPFDHTFEIIKGESSGRSYDAFLGQFSPDHEIDEDDILSGKTAIQFMNIGERTVVDQTIIVVYAFPFDFVLKEIEYQQGIVDQDQSFTLGAQDFPALPFIIMHNGHAQLKVDMVNLAAVEYKKLQFSDLKATLKISREDAILKMYNLDDIELIDENSADKGYLTANDYVPQALFRMDHVFNQSLPGADFPMTGEYELTGEIFFKDPDVVVKSSDKKNDRVTREGLKFVSSNDLNVLVYSARIPDETDHPMIVLEDVFSFLRNTYPVQSDQFKVIDGGKWDVEKRSTFGQTRSALKEEAKKTLRNYNMKNSLKADLLAIMGDTRFVEYICNGAGGISWHTDRIAIFDPFIPQTTSHEIGHILDLGDTYEGGAEEPSVNPPGNIRREGRIAEGGSIHLINETQLQSYSLINFDLERSLYDFMGILFEKSSGGVRDTWVDRLTWDYLYNHHFKKDVTARNTEEFLLVSGTITRDHEVNLDPVIRLTDPPYINEMDPFGHYSIAFSDGDENITFEHRFELDFIVFEVGPVDTVGFLFYLPFDEIYKNMDISFQDSVIFSFTITENKPDILTFSGTYSDDGDSYQFFWEAEDKDGDSLLYSLSYRDSLGEFWPIITEISENQFTWSHFNQIWFDPQSGFILLNSTDGFNEDEASIVVPVSGLVGTADHDLNGMVVDALPNPFKEQLHIEIDAVKDAPILLEVVDVNGKIVNRLHHQIIAGTQTIQLNSERWVKGIYFIKLVDMSSGRHRTLKVLKI